MGLRGTDELAYVIVGAGRVASAFARWLPACGLRVDAIAARRRDAAELLSEELDASLIEISELRTSFLDAHVLICVADEAIPEVAAAIFPDRPGAVLHTSGLLPASVLGREFDHPLAFHPVASIGRDITRNPFHGTVITLQGGNDAVVFGTDLASRLGGLPIPVSVQQKRSIHAASALMANMTVSLAGMFERLLSEASIDPEITLAMRSRLLQSVVDNLTENSAAEALTGPIARGDVETVKDHLELLSASDPELSETYRILGRFALELVRSKSDITDEGLNCMKRLLGRR